MDIRITQRQEDRLNANIAKDSPDGCWLWKRPYKSHRPVTTVSRKDGKSVSRIVIKLTYWLEHGIWPDIIYVTCEDRRCVNPAHAYHSEEDRFLNGMVKRETCWIWTASVRGGGKHGKYGCMRFDGRTQDAHRIAWQLYRGPIPKGKLVMHKCDNTLCVNPEHLQIGTHQDNRDDMMEKGRWKKPRPRLLPRGTKHPHAKLNPEKVRAIRKEYAQGGISFRNLGKKYGVGETAISDITHNKTWKHVSD